MTHAQARIITPVKESLQTALRTFQAVKAAKGHFEYLVYDDKSSPETHEALKQAAERYQFTLLHTGTLTEKPSPNYREVLIDARHKCLADGLPLIIVESDVLVHPDTLQQLCATAAAEERVGMVGAVTVDAAGQVNYPYEKFKGERCTLFETERSLSFCCTLLHPDFMAAYDFEALDSAKDWHDNMISKAVREKGYRNLVLMSPPVQHLPHSSRPWKALKYKNPLLYYWRKFTQGKDKI
ncbi:MAG: glycosyltransferase [Nitritalea sp.]